MNNNNLLQNTTVALIACTILVVVFYNFVDKPVAYFVYNHGINKIFILELCSQIASMFYVLSPLFIILLVIKAYFSPWRRFEKLLLLSSINIEFSLLLSHGIKIFFGRYWPMTWTHNNPALIPDGVFGFNWFKGLNPWYQSFPSGDTTMIFAFMIVFFIAYPKWRWLSASICALEMIGLIGMDYHFVSDVTAGAFLGSITAAWGYYLLKNSLPQIQQPSFISAENNSTKSMA